MQRNQDDPLSEIPGSGASVDPAVGSPQEIQGINGPTRQEGLEQPIGVDSRHQSPPGPIGKVGDDEIPEIGEKEDIELPQIPRELWNDLTESSPQWTAEDKIKAVMAFINFGSMNKAAKAIGIPRQTLCQWKYRPWWGRVMEEAYKMMNQEFVANITRTALTASEELKDRVTHGEYVYKEGEMQFHEDGTPKRQKLTSRRLAFDGISIPIQQRALVAGEKKPQLSTAQVLKEIREAFREIGQEKNVTKDSVLIEQEGEKYGRPD